MRPTSEEQGIPSSAILVLVEQTEKTVDEREMNVASHPPPGRK